MVCEKIFLPTWNYRKLHKKEKPRLWWLIFFTFVKAFLWWEPFVRVYLPLQYKAILFIRVRYRTCNTSYFFFIYMRIHRLRHWLVWVVFTPWVIILKIKNAPFRIHCYCRSGYKKVHPIISYISTADYFTLCIMHLLV